MGSFRDYYNNQNEGIGQFIKGVFNSEYAELPPKLKRYYDLLTPEAHAELIELKQSLQVPLIVALKKYMSESGVRNKLNSWKQMVPPERQPAGRVIPYGQDTPGWKRF